MTAPPQACTVAEPEREMGIRPGPGNSSCSRLPLVVCAASVLASSSGCFGILDPTVHWGRAYDSFEAAVESSDVEKTRRLLVQCPELAYGDSVPIVTASERGSAEMVRLLVRAGADLNRKQGMFGGRRAICLAASKGHLEVVRLLLDAGANIDATEHAAAGRTALSCASERGHASIAQLLIARGANVNHKEDRGRGGPLHYAAGRGHAEIAAMLIENGANVNARLAGGRTPLDLAVRSHDVATVKILLANGAEVRKKVNRYEKTSLHEATCEGLADMVNMLVTAGADINARDKAHGRTPLHWAALNGFDGIAKKLIESGAVLDLKDKSGSTPLKLAHDESMAKLLRDGGSTQ